MTPIKWTPAELACASALLHIEMVRADAAVLLGYLDRNDSAGRGADARRVLDHAVQSAAAAEQRTRDTDPLQALILVADARALLLHVAGECIGLPLGAMKARMSSAGKKGGEKRSAKSAALKTWALTKAEKMRGTPTEIARGLMGIVPKELVAHLANPERVIYDALRAKLKSSS